MYLSTIFSKTTKESAADNVSANADLLTRGGFIYKTLSGVYSYLPLGARVLQKVEQIVREEMDTVGTEVFLSSLCPQDNWAKTGRLDSVDVLFEARGGNDDSRKLNDATYVLCGTHEEVLTPILQHFVSSYQDLPTATYQIQTKFRNEARAKSGILRGREFRMKDLYSFHANEEDMVRYFHEEATPAYQRVFDRLGIGDKTVLAWASGGDFSRQRSIEFQTRCDAGEDLIFYAKKSDQYYNREICPVQSKPWNNMDEEMKEREDVVGKGIIGVEELSKFLKIEVERTTKTILFQVDDAVVAVAVRGGYDVDEHKVKDILGCQKLRLADAKTVKQVTGADVGYAGPIGLPSEVQVLWDDSCKDRRNFECGANVTNEHSINCNFGRDIDEPEQFYDVKVAQAGDIDPETGKPYETFTASEVGNLYTLYTKYSEAFGFTYIDKEGKPQPVYMGCYGLGTTRVMGVIAEVCHDEHGLVWPQAVAPAAAHIVPICKTTDDPAYQEAEKLYQELTAAGHDVLFDDRLDQTVGSRLADVDLIGVPHRFVISQKTLDDKGIEYKQRETGEVRMVTVEEAVGICD